MNKKELICACAEKTRDYKKDAERYIDAILKSITEELASGGEVKLVGFGKFEVRERKGKLARNPKKPQDIYPTSPSKAVKFTAGERLKKSVNR